MDCDHGPVVASGPLDSILEAEGTDYVIGLRGDTTRLRSALTAEPWVAGIAADQRGEVERWRVRIEGVADAHDRILALLCEEDEPAIAEFHPSDRRLEDAYLEMVGADRES